MDQPNELMKAADDLLEKGVAVTLEFPKLSARLSHVSKTDNTRWCSDTLTNLICELELAFSLLLAAVKSPSTQLSALTILPLVSWRARNLLELSIWMMYCARSRKNTKEFYNDKGRDTMNIYAALSKMFEQCLPFEPSAESRLTLLKESQERTHARSIDGEMTGLDEPFTPVYKAAKSLELEPLFRGYNKMLSKFAHPTAFAVLTLFNDEMIKTFNAMSTVMSVPLFLAAMKEVDKLLPPE